MINPKFTRRALLAGVAGASLTALAPQAALAQDDEARLRLQWWGSQPRAERTFAVAELFTEANPNVTIDGETVGWTDYWTRLATQVAGRNAPDVMQQDYRYIFEYAGRGALLDLTPFRDTVLTLEGFDDTTLEGGSLDGKLYGISLGANSVAMMVNGAAFDEAGVAVPDGAVTWDELAPMAKQVAENSELVQYGLEDASGTEHVFENWLRQQGKALYTDDGQLAFTVEDATEWFEFWAGLREDGVIVPPDIQALYQQSIETAMVTQGYAAMSFAHSNQLVGYRELGGETITMLPHPLVSADATGGHYRKPSQFFSVAAGAENPEVAAEFINFFVTNPEAAKILDTERGVPESAKSREVLTPELDDAGQVMVEYISDLGDLAGPLPPPPPQGAGEIDQMMVQVSQQIAFGQLTPAEGAERLVSEAESILSR